MRGWWRRQSWITESIRLTRLQQVFILAANFNFQAPPDGERGESEQEEVRTTSQASTECHRGIYSSDLYILIHCFSSEEVNILQVNVNPILPTKLKIYSLRTPTIKIVYITYFAWQWITIDTLSPGSISISKSFPLSASRWILSFPAGSSSASFMFPSLSFSRDSALVSCTDRGL